MDDLEQEVTYLKDDNENLKYTIARMETSINQVFMMMQASGKFNESEIKIIE
jgi:hypothetical protein